MKKMENPTNINIKPIFCSFVSCPSVSPDTGFGEMAFSPSSDIKKLELRRNCK
jgi:hypothetical protein